MNAVALSSMTQALPEIVLAVGAMGLLMLGAYRERTDSVVSVCSVLLLIAAAVIVAVIPNGTSPAHVRPASTSSDMAASALPRTLPNKTRCSRFAIARWPPGMSVAE